MVCPEPLWFKAATERLRLRLPDPMPAAYESGSHRLSDLHTDARPSLL